MSAQDAIPMTAPPNVYRQRRARLAASLTRPLVIFAGHAPARNYPANAHVFRAGSSYLYFGGPPIENAALLIEPGSDGDIGCTLLRPPPAPDDALWFGTTPSDEDFARAAGLRTGALEAPQRLEKLLAGRATAGVAPPFPDTLAWIERLQLSAADDDELRAIVNLRLCKDEHELAAMRRSAQICMEAQRAALAAARPGRREADVAAAFMKVLCEHECLVSFNPIITIRSEVLHGQGHPNVMPDGALLLIDAGVEEPGGYASDITRTVPVNRRWTPIQRHLYDTALRALGEATAACVPGRRFRDIHDLSARVICEGLVEAELLSGDPAELVARTAHALFYPHGVGHLIGLDAHDMEDFGDLAGYAPGRTRRPEFGNKYVRLDRDLEPNMCLTIEPGIYLVPAIWASDELVRPLADVVNRSKVDALLADEFGGIRIEHTVRVRPRQTRSTSDEPAIRARSASEAPGEPPEAPGPEVLSEDLPVDADEIVACVGVA